MKTKTSKLEKAYMQFGKVRGKRHPHWSQIDAVGFNASGRLCHLTNKGEREITIKESARLLSRPERLPVIRGGTCWESDQDSESVKRWFSMVHGQLIRVEWFDHFLSVLVKLMYEDKRNGKVIGKAIRRMQRGCCPKTRFT